MEAPPREKSSRSREVSSIAQRTEAAVLAGDPSPSTPRSSRGSNLAALVAAEGDDVHEEGQRASEGNVASSSRSALPLPKILPK